MTSLTHTTTPLSAEPVTVAITLDDAALVFTAHRRPYYMAETLQSWKSARGYSQLLDRHVFLDQSDREAAMQAVIRANDDEIHVHTATEKRGVLGNPWHALDYAFGNPEVKFAILAEEDLVVTPDVLDYFKFAMNEYGPEEALGVCAYTENQSSNLEHTYLKNKFDVWIWGLWRESWFETVRDTWDFDYSTNNGTPGIDAGWDHNLNRLAQNKPFVHPDVTRSRHIGRIEGVHMQEQWFHQMQPTTFDLPRPVNINFFRCQGEPNSPVGRGTLD